VNQSQTFEIVGDVSPSTEDFDFFFWRYYMRKRAPITVLAAAIAGGVAYWYMTTEGAGLGFWIATCVTGFFLLGIPFYYFAAKQVLARATQSKSPTNITVSSDGIQFGSGTGTVHAWKQFAAVIESANSYVLVRRQGNSFYSIPKAGVSDEIFQRIDTEITNAKTAA
jgi:hypothetical protein